MDATGALPYGYYTIKELRCPNNKKYTLFEDSFNVQYDVADTSLEIDPEGYRYGHLHGTVNFGTVYNWIGNKNMTSEALTQDEESHYSYTYEDLSIVDTVFYKGIDPEDDYILVGSLVDQETGDAVLDEWGEPIRVEKEFVPTSDTGYTRMTFDLNASELSGKAIVVFERMYKKNEYDADIVKENPNYNLYLGHADLLDKDQTIYFPKMSTTMISEKTEMHLEDRNNGN